MKNLLEKEEREIQQDIDNISFPEYGRNEEDNATEMGDYTASAAMKNNLEERLHNIREALNRIEEGNYGYTPEGEIIPEDRLRANPAATSTIKPEDK